ncbi:TRP-domain-containing protein [Testicularia cyperi]|uniref:TRP-domain-containing protein n=1 Tax=Testicularia cyperi TaxID=1882483 RepID=A0A317XRH5_9BASI|nr:TRP-domain-containing protein [Testicularia cyperi]
MIAAFSSPAVADTGLGGTEMLFTSSAAYCSPPEAIIISALDLRFFRENRTLEFDISAASVQDDLEVTVSVNVNAYGLGLFALTINLCDTIPVLCPLPNYQFQGSGIFAVPEQFVSKIPTIAYTVPNLEAVATVELRDANNYVVGCVQTTLSNGRTTYQPAAKWAVLGVLLLAFVSSLLHTTIASSLGAAQWRIVDVFTTIQHIPMTGLLSLNYPSVFLQFARNFAWSVGLIDIPKVQQSILSTREKTGGSQDGVFGKLLTAEAGKQYNPFTAAGAATARTSTSSNTLSLLKVPAVYAPFTGPGGQIAQNSDSNYLPVIDSTTPPPIGLGYFAELNDISPASVFLTVLVSLAMLFAVIVGICLLVFAFAGIVRLITFRRHGRAAAWSSRLTGRPFFGMFCRPIFGRFIMATFQMYLVFAFWQWLRGDSWVPDFLAAIILVVYLLGIAAIYLPVFRAARNGTREELFYGQMPPANASPVSKRWGAIAHPFRPRFFWFGLVFLLVYFVRACFIGFGQGRGHALRQSIGLAATDLLFFLVLCICRPGRDKTSDFVMILLLIFRVVSWGICIALTPLADIQTIPRVVLGFALIVVTGLPIVFLFFLTVWDLFSPFIRKRQWNATRIGDAEINNEKGNYSFGAVGTQAAMATRDEHDDGRPSGYGSDPLSAGSSSSDTPDNQSPAHLSPTATTANAGAPTSHAVQPGFVPSAPKRSSSAVGQSGMPVEHVDRSGAQGSTTLLAARPAPVHANSAVSAQSGQTTYYDASSTPQTPAPQ